MLVRFEGQREVYPVMAVIFDRRRNQVDIYFSDLGSASSQYRHEIDEETVEIVDHSIPPYWILREGEVGRERGMALTFPEWANDLGESGPGFYERYVDGEPEDIAVMRHYYDIEYERYKDHPHIVKRED